MDGGCAGGIDALDERQHLANRAQARVRLLGKPCIQMGGEGVVIGYATDGKPGRGLVVAVMEGQGC